MAEKGVNVKHAHEKGRVLGGVGGVLALLGAILLVTSVLGLDYGGSGATVVNAQEPPTLQIEKNSGVHSGGPNDGAREYRIRARNNGGPLAPADNVFIIDDVDDDIVILAIHDVNPGWNCFRAQNPFGDQFIFCDLINNASLGDQFEDIFFYDACDTIERGSVDNTASIFLNPQLDPTNVVPEDSDVANPNVFDCEPTTPTATPTRTPATATVTPTGTQQPTSTPTPTPVVAVITPPVTGTGGLSGGGGSVAWFGLASLLAGLGLLGWARSLWARR
jgi:hypothetical protein